MESKGKYFIQGEQSTINWEKFAQVSLDMVCTTNADGVYTYVSEASLDMLGYASHEMIGRPFQEFLHPEDIAKTEQGMVVVLEGTKKRDFQNRLLHKDGHVVTVQWSSVWSVEDGLLYSTARDITSLVQAYETIKQQNLKLNTLFDSITDALVIVDTGWHITFFNREAERLLPIDRPMHLGENVWKVFPEAIGGEPYTKCYQAVQTGRTVTFTTFHRGLDKWFHVKAFPSPEGLSIYFDDVSDLVKAKEELEKLALVASKTTQGVIITNAEGITEWVNEGFTHLLGFSMEDMVGKKPGAVMQGPKTDPDTVAYIRSMLQKQLPFNATLTNYTKEGTELFVAMDITPIFSGSGNLVRFIAILQDVTAQVHTQQELERLALVASKTNNGVLICDSEWRIQWVNEGFTRLLGYSLEEALGQQPKVFLKSHHSDSTDIAPPWQNLYKGELVSFKAPNGRKDGTDVWLSVDISPIFNEKGELTTYVVVQTDITDLKSSELELSKLADDLYRQNSDLQKFTYIVSHNLRSPVSNALGITQLMTRTDKHSNAFDVSLDYLSQSIQKLDAVLRDMNTILTVRDSAGNLWLEEVDVRNVLEQALSSFQEQLELVNAQVSVRTQEVLLARANKAYLYSIFHNLISNSLKYRSQDRPLQLSIKCFGSQGKATAISFSDNGSGFDTIKARGNIFKLYKRFHKEQEGRGMGLYLVKSHLDAMGGHIEVTSQIGVGTRFLIYFPQV
ncbi:PAS domain S-box protein [Nibribacter ruber]|uniref:histidine kinase n=1 Tax=Nibribacter ruber TaxID=2698458 RepID=A0A6P1P071_9BACT|nr:PAS domain-containing sensor histidine kinase [Nibribacter ruber]QHL87935.1 PAS domain S-box protein [Nibribacter ruber]